MGEHENDDNFRLKLIIVTYTKTPSRFFSDILEQVQNFPQDNNKCKIFPSQQAQWSIDTMVAGSNLSWQGIKRKAVYTEGVGPVFKCTGQCTLEGSVGEKF